VHVIFRILFYAIGAYSLLCAIFNFAQNRLLYFPDANRPDVSGIHALGLEFWPDPEPDFRGYFCHPGVDSDRGTVIVFHGNAGAAWNRDYYCEPLSALGYRIILAEYPGYGGRPGKPSEDILIKDARETIRLVLEHYSNPVYVIGESLGAGVIAAAVADTSLITDGICLITPWAALSDLAQSLYPFLPVKLLIRNHFDSMHNLEKYSGRIAVAVADHDEVVTTAQGLKLFESIKADKKLWMMKDTSHNTWMFRIDPSFWKEVMNYLTDTGQ
jgi:pimeloyl-ACP methyl ester carboxylesterase